MTVHRSVPKWDWDPAVRKNRIWRLECPPCGFATGWVSQKAGPLAMAKTAVRRMDEHLEANDP